MLPELAADWIKESAERKDSSLSCGQARVSPEEKSLSSDLNASLILNIE